MKRETCRRETEKSLVNIIVARFEVVIKDFEGLGKTLAGSRKGMHHRLVSGVVFAKCLPVEKMRCAMSLLLPCITS